VIGLALAAAVGLSGPKTASRREERAADARVVFVCAHGNVKSVVASAWFNKLAAERGIAARSVARGLEPPSPVPPLIADHLRADGLELRGFEPAVLSPPDAAGAAWVILIGVEPPPWLLGTGTPAEVWRGVPPASERYELSRDALRRRIDVLLERLATHRAQP
jgi:hypothetical protein